jgi:sRNA-binding carbon storage regulator CsrA
MSRLALTRRAEQGIVLRYPGGPTVYIYVSKIFSADGQVRLAIEAPPTVAIHREEVLMHILEERLDALPPVAMSEEECEQVRECASLIEAARLVAQAGNNQRRGVAQRLLDRLGGIGRLGRPAQIEAVGSPVATPGAPTPVSP